MRTRVTVHSALATNRSSVIPLNVLKSQPTSIARDQHFNFAFAITCVICSCSQSGWQNASCSLPIEELDIHAEVIRVQRCCWSQCQLHADSDDNSVVEFTTFALLIIHIVGA